MYDLQDSRWLKNINQVRPSEHEVVLTFDDGPSRYLDEILDLLQAKVVPALFFWQSRLLHDQRPWQRVLTEGHKIGSHAHNHKNLVKLDRQQQYEQVKSSVKQIEAITGEPVRYFRPPFGRYNEDTMAAISQLGLTPVMWDISSYDWELKADPSQIICNVANHVRGGSIILLHELAQTVTVLPEIIDKVRDQGFEFTMI
ncbi:polysaccharide deacetylase family protein [Desertibacillus haloalkaliphilus]|uniref:polysaccharide deacetylase family protein n=1 Tax=Desertibacillus haloalkaliphilus TaxID=1328930 RepID=UPI001C27E9DE|nr:polysaccharide deacetylase family protein [Desertibacillus haloalkaliphilus]MBU8906669.1 polysaccharide deacetylase family protein [Desertibacillus haloalkaliphilus]